MHDTAPIAVRIAVATDVHPTHIVSYQKVTIRFYFSTYPLTHLPTYDKKVFYRY